MVTQWGMSERLGAVCYSDEDEHVFLGSEITRSSKHGEKIAQQIDEEIRVLLHEAHSAAKETLQQHSQAIQTLTQTLLKLETVEADEVKQLIEGGSLEDLVEQREKQKEQEAEEETDARENSGGEVAEGPSPGDMPAPAGSPA
jgi:cell division protease FtsH